MHDVDDGLELVVRTSRGSSGDDGDDNNGEEEEEEDVLSPGEYDNVEFNFEEQYLQQQPSNLTDAEDEYTDDDHNPINKRGNTDGSSSLEAFFQKIDNTTTEASAIGKKLESVLDRSLVSRKGHGDSSMSVTTYNSSKKRTLSMRKNHTAEQHGNNCDHGEHLQQSNARIASSHLIPLCSHGKAPSAPPFLSITPIPLR